MFNIGYRAYISNDSLDIMLTVLGISFSPMQSLNHIIYIMKKVEGG